ncbi:MAG: hypothetical protein ACXVMS_14855 [Flavisolibacter sp.]
MLSLLTKYLLQYRRLSIPHVGSFELVSQPAAFNVVDQLMMPPYFHLNWQKNDQLTDHQLAYIAASRKTDKEKIKRELEVFGENLKTRVGGASFTWNGIGVISQEDGVIAIKKALLPSEGWEPVTAHKMIRQNASHNMLVGDREMTSLQMSGSLGHKRLKRSNVVLIGWILFFLTLLAILFLLYKNGFNPLSTGLKMKAAGNSLY